MSPIVSLIALVVWIICLVANIKIAKKKGRNVAKWVILSIFFSWIVLIINAVTDPKK